MAVRNSGGCAGGSADGSKRNRAGDETAPVDARRLCHRTPVSCRLRATARWYSMGLPRSTRDAAHAFRKPHRDRSCE